MTLGEYIKKYINKEEKLPFETVVYKYKKNAKIFFPGQIEKNISFLISGIVEVGRIKDEKETIFDFKYPNRFLSAFSSYHNQEKSDIYMSCITDCVIEKIPLLEFEKALKTSLIVNQLARHMFLQAYLEVVKKERDSSTKTPRERYLELIENNPTIIQDIPDFKIAKYLGIHPTSLSLLKKTALLGVS